MDEVLNKLADKFAATPLPAGVCADLCAADPHYPHARYGTNLLTVAQAKQMLAEVLGDMLDEDWLTDVIDGSIDMDWTGRVGARAILRALASSETSS